VLFKHLWCPAAATLGEFCKAWPQPDLAMFRAIFRIAAGCMSSFVLLKSCAAGKRAAHFKSIVLHDMRRTVRPGSAVEPLVKITGKILNLGAVAE